MIDKKIIVKFEVTVETDTSMVLGDTYEDKLQEYRTHVEEALEREIRHWGETTYSIDCVEEKVEDYEI